MKQAINLIILELGREKTPLKDILYFKLKLPRTKYFIDLRAGVDKSE